jgi:hypothetical protein
MLILDLYSEPTRRVQAGIRSKSVNIFYIIGVVVVVIIVAGFLGVHGI